MRAIFLLGCHEELRTPYIATHLVSPWNAVEREVSGGNGPVRRIGVYSILKRSECCLDNSGRTCDAWWTRARLNRLELRLKLMWLSLRLLTYDPWTRSRGTARTRVYSWLTAKSPHAALEPDPMLGRDGGIKKIQSFVGQD